MVKPGNEVGKKIGDPVSLVKKQEHGASSTIVNANPLSSRSHENPMPTNQELGASSTTVNANPLGTTSNENPMAPPPPKKAKIDFHFINQLNENVGTYVNWKIKPRVTAKSEIRYWKNEKGEGKYFTFDLIDKDEDGNLGRIRATAFNDMADKYHGMIEVILF